MEDNNIIDITKRVQTKTRDHKDADLLPTNSFYRTGTKPCRHHAVAVDKESRIVECRRCGKELDAITVLYEYALHERELLCVSNDIRIYRKEINDLKDELRKLKAKISSARATLRQLGL